MKIIISALAIFCSILAFAQQSDTTYGVDIEKSVQIEMRDGTHLSVDLYRPSGKTDKQSTILVRTPYSKNFSGAVNDPYQRSLVHKGYTLAIADMRGRFESEGLYKPAVNERNDSYDLVSWITEQSWSDNKVATMGCSYLGDAQVILAATRHPSHVAAIPMASATGYLAEGRPWQAYDGGVFELAQTAGWFSGSGSEVVYGPPAWIDRQEWFQSEASKGFVQTQTRNQIDYYDYVSSLPIVDILKKSGAPPTDYVNFVSNNPNGEYFRNLDWAKPDDRFNTPMLMVDSWYDYGVAESLELWQLAQDNAVSDTARDNQFLVIAPTTHCAYTRMDGSELWSAGDRDMGSVGFDFLDMQTRWYDRWLSGEENGITDMPKIQYFLMGKNEWKGTDVWPVANTEFRKFYLSSDGNANSRFGDGRISLTAPNVARSDHYVYDPATPVPSIGGQACCTGLETGAGAFDQSATEMRQDVLVYTSDTLKEGIEVTGSLEVVLYVSSDAKDTDFMAKLVDVYPDGTAFNVQEGALRMRYREGFENKVWMETGEVYEARLNLHATSNYFGPGHKIRLEVSSSSFPRFDRNLNTGGNNYDESEWVLAKNALHHSADHPSHVILPVVP